MTLCSPHLQQPLVLFLLGIVSSGSSKTPVFQLVSKTFLEVYKTLSIPCPWTSSATIQGVTAALSATQGSVFLALDEFFSSLGNLFIADVGKSERQQLMSMLSGMVVRVMLASKGISEAVTPVVGGFGGTQVRHASPYKPSIAFAPVLPQAMCAPPGAFFRLCAVLVFYLSMHSDMQPDTFQKLMSGMRAAKDGCIHRFSPFVCTAMNVDDDLDEFDVSL